MDFQPVLIELLNSVIDVIAEDYVGTELAWGMTFDLNLTELELLNFGLIQPDFTVLLDGKRFKDGIEKGHKFEESPNETWNKNRSRKLLRPMALKSH